MTHEQHGCHGDRMPPPWDEMGRAAERFARRVADDAKLFAERVEEHVGYFANDLRREWRRPATGGGESAENLRHIFDDVRGIVRGVLDGVDDLVAGLFRDQGESEWSKLVLNRDATCGGCGKTAAAGSEAWMRRTASGTEFRCGLCGGPGA